MGTKNNPGDFDCYEKADPDEPMFVLLGRDVDAPDLVELWALQRLARGHGHKEEKPLEALGCAQDMREYANRKLGIHIKPKPHALGILRQIVADMDANPSAEARLDDTQRANIERARELINAGK